MVDSVELRQPLPHGRVQALLVLSFIFLVVCSASTMYSPLALGQSRILPAAQTRPEDRATTPQRTQNQQLTGAESSAFCEHVHSAQRSEAARLRSPWISARGSTLQRAEVAAGGGPGLLARARAGVGFSVSDWLEADILAERADALCAVHRAEQAAKPTESDEEAILASGWKEKSRSLEQALEQASILVESSVQALKRSERTITQHLRILEAYQSLSEQSSDALAKSADLSLRSPPHAPDPALGNQLYTHVSNLERNAGRLRRNSALSISVEAGYDELIGTAQTLPVYGQLNAVFRPGYFWQQRADDQSASARARSALLQLRAHDQAYAQARQRIELQRKVMQRQAQQLRGYTALLVEQRQALVGLDNPEAIFIAEQLWFSLELKKAELSRLEISLGSIDRWLSTTPASAVNR